MLSLHGFRKPVYIAHMLLNRLGDRRVPVAGDGEEQLEHAIVTTRGDARQALVYCFAEQERPERVEIALLLDRPAEAPRLPRLGERENIILSVYRAIGAPAYPTRAQLRDLRAADKLAAAHASEVRIEKTADGWVALCDGARRPRLVGEVKGFRISSARSLCERFAETCPRPMALFLRAPLLT